MLAIGLILVLVLVFVTNPDLISKVWLYVIGFIGYIISLGEKGVSAIKKAFSSKSPEENSRPAMLAMPASEGQTPEVKEMDQKIRQIERRLESTAVEGAALGGSTLTILRYYDDGETTLGLLFIRDKFFAYALEDTHREEKLQDQTRIPAGHYAVDFNRTVTPMTERYRASKPWFTYHLEIKAIPNYSNVYIHIGNNHTHTSGCVLIADGVSAGMPRSIIQSALTYEKFYLKISSLLSTNEKVTIRIYDEDWFEKCKIPSL